MTADTLTTDFTTEPTDQAGNRARHTFEALTLGDHVRRIRIRHQLVPYPVVGILWAGAAAAHQNPVVAPIALALALVGAVVWWLAWGKRNPMARYERRRWLTTIAVSATWFAWAAIAGAGGLRAAVLWGAAYALAWPYWRRHTIPMPTEPTVEPEPAPRPEPVSAEPPPVVTFAQRWATEVAHGGGPVPGSYLTEREVIPEGESYTIVLDGQRHSVSKLLSLTEPVGSALKMRAGELSVARHPSGRYDLGRLIVVDPDRSPLRQRHEYPGPEACYDATNGRAWIGVHVDATPAHWSLWRPGWGACGGVVIGGTGSGKSRLLDNVITTGAYAVGIVPWIADAQEGASLPSWSKRADWSATTPDEVLRMLAGAVTAMKIRSTINALLGRSVWIPSATEPMLLIFVDECHRVFNQAYGWMSEDGAKRAVGYGSRIAREGRKAGVAMICASQYPGLDTFGNNAPLRDSLLAGNGAVFRIASNSAGPMLPGLGVNPAEIPAITGVACLTTPGAVVDGDNGIDPSALPYRGWWQPDEDVERLAAAAPTAVLDRATVAALGATYADRHTRRQAADAEHVATLADLDPDLAKAILAARPELADALTAHRRRADTPAPTPAQPTAAPAVPRLTLVPAPVFQAPEPSPVTAADQITDLIRAGTTAPRDLIRATGYSPAHVHKTLADLEATGRIRKVAHGTYQAAA